jgi:NADPH:quinone reductase-like Zn-dependent oxidoreductase
MKTMRLSDGVANHSLLEFESPVPEPGRDEVLVRVHAAGVTPTELLWYPTTHTKTGGPRLDAVPGHEFSGVIAAAGDKGSEFKVGNEVYGLNDWFAEGATAEYCLAQTSSIAFKPRRLSHVEAASTPIGALTAWEGLFDRAGLMDGERVLIHGGAGAVGVYAIQMARRAGAHVITTASAGNIEFVQQLGADEVFDYKTAPFEDRVSEVDVVFDGVGGATLERSWNVLKPSGRLVTIAADSETMKDARTKAAFFIVAPKQQRLAELADLFDRGELKAFVAAVLPWREASAAYFGTGKQKKGHGKLVIAVADEIAVDK